MGNEEIEQERQRHPERFAPRSAPPGFGGYSAKYISETLKIVRDARKAVRDKEISDGK